MALFLLALVILLLTAELSAFVWVADTLGWWDAIALSLLISLVGVWFTKRAGLGVVRRIQQTSRDGRVPSRELADAALILAAGVLLLLPGFVTDALGAALLVPPFRAGVRILAIRHVQKNRRLVVTHSRYGIGSDVRDAESWEEPGKPDQGQIGEAP